MKIKSHVFCALFCPFIFLGQAYIPLLDTQNEWHFTTCYEGECLTDIYYTDGDTLVNNQNHKILDGFHYISRTFLLREDISSKKVFLTKINPNRIDEYLLYDFSLEIGDTFEMKNPISPIPTEAGLYVLDEIILQPIFENDTRKHFYFSPHSSNTISTNTAIWVEGVGSLSLINAPSGFPDQNGIGLLNCFFKNSVLFYSDLNSEVTSCNALLSNTSSFTNLEVKAYFPYQDKICLVTNTSNINKILLFDYSGRKLHEYQNNNHENELLLNLNAYSKGVYVLKIIYKNSKTKTLKIAF